MRKAYIVTIRSTASQVDVDRLDLALRELLGDAGVWITTDLVTAVHEVTVDDKGGGRGGVL